MISFASDTPELRAVVDVDVVAKCPRCAAGKGCGAGLFATAATTRRIEVSIPSGLQLSEGDLVEIAVEPDNLLLAALLVYGFPLLGAIVAAAVAYQLSPGDGFAAGATATGLFAGGLIGRLCIKRDSCLRRFVPVIEKRVADAETPS